MIKVIHTGDIHLDSPFSGLDEARAEVRKTELRGTFSSLMTYVRLNSVNMLLIAGDFFDRGFVTRETVAIVLREFSRVPECKIIISPGNHDPFTSDSVYAKVKFPDNVYIFNSESQECFSFPELGVDVYGYAFTGEAMNECPVEKTEDNGRFKILCAHAHLGSAQSPYAPVSASRLASCGFDYAALGHIHNPAPISEEGGCVMAYSGCIEGRSFDETGMKGAIYLEINENDKNISVKNIYFSKKRYECETLNVTGVNSLFEITEKIRGIIREKRYGAETLLRVTLKGEIPSSLVISEKLIVNDIGDVFMLEIRDETTSNFNDEYLMKDPTVKGEFYRLLRPRLMDEDAAVRASALKALRYGFAAMAGENITD